MASSLCAAPCVSGRRRSHPAAGRDKSGGGGRGREGERKRVKERTDYLIITQSTMSSTG